MEGPIMWLNHITSKTESRRCPSNPTADESVEYVPLKYLDQKWCRICKAKQKQAAVKADAARVYLYAGYNAMDQKYGLMPFHACNFQKLKHEVYAVRHAPTCLRAWSQNGCEIVFLQAKRSQLCLTYVASGSGTRNSLLLNVCKTRGKAGWQTSATTGLLTNITSRAV